MIELKFQGDQPPGGGSSGTQAPTGGDQPPGGGSSSGSEEPQGGDQPPGGGNA